LRIAITSRLYFPIIGGTPVLLRLLARAFVELGHAVKLITKTEGPANSGHELYETYRGPDQATIKDIAGWSDVVFQIEAGLALAFPFILKKKPVVISHHTICGLSEGFNAVLWLQRMFARFNTVTSVSDSVRNSWGGHGYVIGNCYDNKVFFDKNEIKNRELLFVGRLIPTKGVEVLLNALSILKREGLTPDASFIGDEITPQGSATALYKSQAAALGLSDQVEFLGSKTPEQVAEEMRSSRVLVIPSTWHEPFGIVALEGLASGCHLVASRHGGLPTAGGSFAHYFENGSADDLARALREALFAQTCNLAENHALKAHLEAHSPQSIAQKYIELFQHAINGKSHS